VTLLCGEVVKSFGDHAGVVLKECIGVLLQVLEPLPPLLEGGQLPASTCAGFIEGGELGP